MDPTNAQPVSDNNDLDAYVGSAESPVLSSISLQSIMNLSALTLKETHADSDSNSNFWRTSNTTAFEATLPSHPQETPQEIVFRNQDIMEIVLACFHRSSISDHLVASDTQHLLWAALTCRDFFEPAMNVLWKSVRSIPQWLSLIPTFTRSGDEYTTTGIIVRDSLVRLMQYSRRIRHFTVEHFIGGVSSHIYYFLDRFCEGPLLPGLNTLQIMSINDIPSEALYGLLLMASSSAISTVLIGGINGVQEVKVGSILECLYLANPRSLKRLTLQGSITRASFDLIRKFQNISTLSIDIVDTALESSVLAIFASMEFLQVLKFKSDKVSTFARTSETVVHFISLYDLEITGHVAMIHGLLLSIDATHLASINLHFIVAEDGILAPSVRPQALADACIKRCTEMTQSLSSFDIAVRLSGLPPSAPLPTTTGLGTLAKCSKLKHLGMPLNTLLSLRLSTILATTEWNNLEALSLHIPMRPYIGSTAPTLLSIAHVARGCPKLRILQISIFNLVESACITQMENAFNRTEPVKHGLHVLRILPFHGKLEAQRASMKAAVTVSRYIDHFFPRLKVLDLSKFAPFVGVDWCEGVVEMIKTYQSLEAQRSRNAIAVAAREILNQARTQRLSGPQVRSLEAADEGGILISNDSSSEPLP